MTANMTEDKKDLPQNEEQAEPIKDKKDTEKKPEEKEESGKQNKKEEKKEEKTEKEKKEKKVPEEKEQTEEKKEKESPEPSEPEKKKEPEEKTPADLLKEANDRYLRLLAEYDNYRKRSNRERDALYGDTKAEVLKSFLPVYDNLERALKQSTEDEAYRKGVEMIMTQFNDVISKLGVTEIECIGKTFDPKYHNAVMHVEDETKGENEVVDVFQKGFRLGDRVIRFAMVKVAN
jgi:molecular chaperone GrpE